MKKPIRLYNILFPIWLFWLLPTMAWLIILPVNFAFDSLVLGIVLKVQHVKYKFKVWRQSILKIWIIGFISDWLGAAGIMGLRILLDSSQHHWDTVYFPGTTLISLPGVILAGLLIYFLNRRFSFTKCGLSALQVRNLSLALAVFTAPYAMLIPRYG